MNLQFLNATISAYFQYWAANSVLTQLLTSTKWLSTQVFNLDTETDKLM